MERLAGRRGVVEEPGIGRDRLAARLADIGDVIARGQPGPLPVAPDPLADDRAHGRIVGRRHQGREPARKHPVVRVVEGDPVAADGRETVVARGRHADVRREPDEDEARVAIGNGLHDVRGPVGRPVVDDEALERERVLVENGGEGAFDRGSRVPARDEHAQSRGIRLDRRLGVDRSVSHQSAMVAQPCLTPRCRRRTTIATWVAHSVSASSRRGPSRSRRRAMSA